MALLLLCHYMFNLFEGGAMRFQRNALDVLIWSEDLSAVLQCKIFDSFEFGRMALDVETSQGIRTDAGVA